MLEFGYAEKRYTALTGFQSVFLGAAPDAVLFSPVQVAASSTCQAATPLPQHWAAAGEVPQNPQSCNSRHISFYSAPRQVKAQGTRGFCSMHARAGTQPLSGLK